MTTGKTLNGKPYVENPHMRLKSHHAPQKLRFGGYIAEGNPNGAKEGFCNQLAHKEVL